MPYYVYILSSRSRTLYTGVTNDIVRRAGEHRSGQVPGFTRKYRIHRLVHFEPYEHPNAAIAREKQIKGWLRAKKIALIEKDNPTWNDLAAGWFESVGNEAAKQKTNQKKAGPSLRSG